MTKLLRLSIFLPFILVSCQGRDRTRDAFEAGYNLGHAEGGHECMEHVMQIMTAPEVPK